jgi:hypothetical protein
MERGLSGHGQLEHHEPVRAWGVEFAKAVFPRQIAGNGLGRVKDAHFRFDDGYEPGSEDLPANPELLAYDGFVAPEYPPVRTPGASWYRTPHGTCRLTGWKSPMRDTRNAARTGSAESVTTFSCRRS